MRLESHKVTQLSNGPANLETQSQPSLRSRHSQGIQPMHKYQQLLDFLQRRVWVGLAITLALMSGLRETLALWRAGSKNS